jgi:hypothetical protein
LKYLYDFSRLKKSLADVVSNSAYKPYFILGAILILSLFLFERAVTLILGLLLTDLLISKWMARSGPPGIGLETASLATIIAGFSISPTTGGFVGGIAMLMRMAVGLSGAFILWKIPGFVLLGFLSGRVIDSVSPQAIILLAFFRTGFILSSKFLENTSIAPKITFSATNLVLVYILANRITKFGII